MPAAATKAILLLHLSFLVELAVFQEHGGVEMNAVNEINLKTHSDFYCGGENLRVRLCQLDVGSIRSCCRVPYVESFSRMQLIRWERGNLGLCEGFRISQPPEIILQTSSDDQYCPAFVEVKLLSGALYHAPMAYHWHGPDHNNRVYHSLLLRPPNETLVGNPAEDQDAN